ncbi:MAG: GldG family protein [Nitrospinales bacterium]
MGKVSGKYVKFIIYLIVLILVNVAGTTLFFRVDLTENRMFSISDYSKQMVATLSEPLTINVFFTKNLPPPYNNVEQYLHDLLEEYALYSNNFFNYRFYDVSLEEGAVTPETRANRDLASDYGIEPVQIQNIENDEVKFQRAYMGLALIHGDLVERIPTITATDGLEYKLTTAIQKLNHKISALLNLSGKIQTKLFLSSSLENVAPYMKLKGLQGLPEKFKDIVKNLNAKNYDKLEFHHIDPATERELEEASKKYNVMSLKWPALLDGKIPAGQGLIGLVMEYGNKFLRIPLLNVLRIPIIGTRYDLVNIDNIEQTLNDNLEFLVDINEDLGFLADHGTPSLSGAMPMGQPNPDSLAIFNKMVSQNYTIKNVYLSEEKIPDDINALLIARPTETFTDYELYQIDQALMRGKNLILFLDRYNEIFPQDRQSMIFNRGPRYVEIDTGLEKLLNHYGIRIKPGYVMDENSFNQQVPRQFGGGERKLYFVPVIQNQFINHNVPFMKNIKGLVVSKISPLALDDETLSKSGLKASMLFTSSDRSWEMTDNITTNPMLIRAPTSEDELKSIPLAYLLEGEFPSYFADKPIPEKPGSDADSAKSKDSSDEKSKSPDLSKIEEKGATLAKGKPAKIFLIATAEILKDTMLDVEGVSTNATFIMNVVDALNHREGIAEMRSKEQQFNPLNDIAPGTKIFTKAFNIAGLPVIVILFGVAIGLARNRRKKKIQMIFQHQGEML